MGRTTAQWAERPIHYTSLVLSADSHDRACGGIFLLGSERTPKPMPHPAFRRRKGSTSADEIEQRRTGERTPAKRRAIGRLSCSIG